MEGHRCSLNLTLARVVVGRVRYTRHPGPAPRHDYACTLQKYLNRVEGIPCGHNHSMPVSHSSIKYQNTQLAKPGSTVGFE